MIPREEFDKLKDAVKDIKDYVDEIRLAVVGNTNLGIRGLGRRVTDLEREQMKFNLRVAKWSGGATVCVLILSEVIKHYWK